jgi:hypothetical protein
MREVPVPNAFARHPSRRPLVLLAAWLVVLQAFLAGIATAQAGAVSVADPLAVVCHGAGGGSSTDAPLSDAGKAWHVCCTVCLASVPALLAPEVSAVIGADTFRAGPRPVLADFGVILARTAIRAGPSQGPPAFA